MTRQHALSFALRILLIVAFVLITHHALHITAVAQSTTATLSGTVVDQNGAVIPGADVKITNPATAFSRETKTNDAGDYIFPLLPPGTYSVTTQRESFAPVRMENVVLNVGDQKALQIQLKAGDVNATVTVSSDAETVRTDGSVGTVINRQFVANMPLNGRTFQSLISLTPGFVFKTTGVNTSNPGQFSINGQRADANYFTVDGVSANFGSSSVADPAATAGAEPALTASGGTQSLVSVDALQEFKVHA